jgi:hypothetical protein
MLIAVVIIGRPLLLAILLRLKEFRASYRVRVCYEPDKQV